MYLKVEEIQRKMKTKCNNIKPGQTNTYKLITTGMENHTSILRNCNETEKHRIDISKVMKIFQGLILLRWAKK